MRISKAVACILLLAGLLVAGLIGPELAESQGKKVKVLNTCSSPMEAPWCQVVHRAFNNLKDELNLEYAYVEKLSAADYERVLREFIARGFDVISGESFSNEGAARRVARDNSKTPFIVGSGLGPQKPNFSVFDNYIHEAAYLAGMMAGKVTKTNTLGFVGGYAVGEVNRLINAFRLGARAVNPKVKVKITFIGAWFNPPKVKEAAFAQIEAGADVLYAERHGVIEAAKERKVLAVGNLLDQYSEAPEHVITSITWHMEPTLRAAFKAIRSGTFKGENYKKYTMLRAGGAALAPWHGWDKKLGPEIVAMVEKKRKEIVSGKFTVPIIDDVPKSD